MNKDLTEEVESLIDYFGNLSSGEVGEAIMRWFISSDCSPNTRQEICQFIKDNNNFLDNMPDSWVENLQLSHVVYLNMLRGTIAKLTEDQVMSLYPNLLKRQDERKRNN